MQTIKYTTKGEGHAKFCNKRCKHTGVGIGSIYCATKCGHCVARDKDRMIVVCDIDEKENQK